jgi:hypothetical protein
LPPCGVGQAHLIPFIIPKGVSNNQILSNLQNMKRVLLGVQKFPNFAKA